MKCLDQEAVEAVRKSPPTRGAWIEMIRVLEAAEVCVVAPHTGGVD